MQAAARLVGFIGVADLAAAQRFYADVLDLELIDERPFALVADIAGTMLRITRVDRVAAAPYTVLGWQVDDIDLAVEELASRGVEFHVYDGMGQDRRGIWTAPGGSRVAWFHDPDGNVLSLQQSA